MSHLGTRLLADRFADDDEGVNSIVQEVPVHDGDALPSDVITVYDDTRDLWVAQGQAPGDDPIITHPLIRIVTMGVQYQSGVPAIQSTNAHTVDGTLQVMVQLILKDDDGPDAIAHGMYWLRAMRGVIARFDDPSNEDARTFGGIRLHACTSIAQGKPDLPLGDTLVSPGAFLLSYPFTETVPLPLALH